MKKFLDRPENVKEEMQQALAVLSPGIVRLLGDGTAFYVNFSEINFEGEKTP